MQKKTPTDWITLRAAAKLLGHQTQTSRIWVHTGRYETARKTSTGYFQVSRAEVESILGQRVAAKQARLERRRAAKLAALARKAA